MNEFLGDNFLLLTKTARILYHDFAAAMPIIDYHSHLPAGEIAADIRFNNLTQAWLQGDHYKWRAMRANGIDEEYVTGQKTDEEKFGQWAQTVPYTLRNPLYHWTHLELRRYFNIKEFLSGKNAQSIYNQCNALLREPDYSVRALLGRMRVQVVCTTDDPVDDLRYHRQLQQEDFGIRVLPTYRPDKALQVHNPESFNQYVDQLQLACNQSITTFRDFYEALKSRHDFFHEAGCRVADHGLDHLFAEDFTEATVSDTFSKLRAQQNISPAEANRFKSALLYYFSVWHHEKGWVQQFHLGALRNNSDRLYKRVGADAGVDSIGDFSQAQQLSRFLNRLDAENKLTKTILYNLNPAHNAVVATMAGNFNDGSIPGKIQFGAAWWFLDQKDGMTDQLNTLSNMGLVSRFVGMLTDSRSFLSFPRHEYFRRILCNLFGADIERGELPYDLDWVGKIIQDICYHNAKSYFQFDTGGDETAISLKKTK